MKPAYSVTIDRGHGLLRLTLAGFFDDEIIKSFVAERDAAVSRLGCSPNKHVTLCDISNQKISSPEILATFRQAIADPRYASRKLAFVVTGALERMQTRRTAARDNVGYFETVAAAESWLFADYDEATELDLLCKSGEFSLDER